MISDMSALCNCPKLPNEHEKCECWMLSRPLAPAEERNLIGLGNVLVCKENIRSNGAAIRIGDRVKVIGVGPDLSKILVQVFRTGTIRVLNFSDADRYFEESA